MTHFGISPDYLEFLEDKERIKNNDIILNDVINFKEFTEKYEDY